MPLELYAGARLTKYPEQTLCLPHPKMELRNQTQRLPSKDWSTIKLRGLLTRQAVTPAITWAVPGGRGSQLCLLGSQAGAGCPGCAGTLSSRSAASKRPCLSDCAPGAEAPSRNTNVRSDYFNHRLL